MKRRRKDDFGRATQPRGQHRRCDSVSPHDNVTCVWPQGDRHGKVHQGKAGEDTVSWLGRLMGVRR